MMYKVLVMIISLMISMSLIVIFLMKLMMTLKMMTGSIRIALMIFQ